LRQRSETYAKTAPVSKLTQNYLYPQKLTQSIETGQKRRGLPAGKGLTCEYTKLYPRVKKVFPSVFVDFDTPQWLPGLIDLRWISLAELCISISVSPHL